MFLTSCAIISAASLREKSVEEMAVSSRFCARIEVESVQDAVWNTFPFSVYKSRVLEVLKGAPQSRVEFVVPGNQKAKQRVMVSGAPKFDAGGEYVVCLNPDPRRPEVNAVTFWTSYQVRRDQRTGQRNLVRQGEFEHTHQQRGLRSASHRDSESQSYDEVVTRIMESN